MFAWPHCNTLTLLYRAQRVPDLWHSKALSDKLGLCSLRQRGIPIRLPVAVVTRSIIRVSVGLCEPFALAWEGVVGEQLYSRVSGGQHAVCVCVHTLSRSQTLESCAVAAQHWDTDRRMPVAMVTAGHRGSTVTATPRDDGNATHAAPSANHAATRPRWTRRQTGSGESVFVTASRHARAHQAPKNGT